MDYKESRNYIEYAQKFGSVLGLNNMEEMMKRLGNPQNNIQFVHVAGTNGKGSVIAYVTTVLTEAGYKVGRYVSPTLFSYLERIAINGNSITEDDFAKCVTKVSVVAEEMAREGLAHPTPFELETAVAFLYFKEQNCDLVLLETGLGGLLDATNIITTTKIAVITSISMDHMEYLGNTLTEIARNKAGIIKSGCQVVSVQQLPDAMSVIRGTSRQMRATLHVADSDEAQVLESSYLGQRFQYKGVIYSIQMPGTCQIENAVVAIETLQVLAQCGFPVDEATLLQGLSMTMWRGRFTLLQEEPLFIIDGAHNPDAARRLEESIQTYFHGKKIIYLLGMFKDKDYDSVAQITAKYADIIYTIATPGNERALPPEELAKTVRKYNHNVVAMRSPEEAVKAAFSRAQPEDVIIAFGSLAFLGDITNIVEKSQEKNQC